MGLGEMFPLSCLKVIWIFSANWTFFLFFHPPPLLPQCKHSHTFNVSFIEPFPNPSLHFTPEILGKFKGLCSVSAKFFPMLVKTPSFGGVINPKTNYNHELGSNFFSWVIWHINKWTYWFLKNFHVKWARTECFKKLLVRDSTLPMNLKSVLYPYFLPRPIQSIGHKVCVFDVCQPRPIIHKLIQSAILCNYAWNIPFMGVYQDVLLWPSVFLNKWLNIHCRIQNTKYKIQWWKYKNMIVHKKTSW